MDTDSRVAVSFYSDAAAGATDNALAFHAWPQDPLRALTRPNDASRSDAITLNTMSSVADAMNAELARPPFSKDANAVVTFASHSRTILAVAENPKERLTRPNDASRSDAIAMNTMSSIADAPNAEFAITLVFAFDRGSRWIYRFTRKVWHSTRVNDSEVIDQYFVSWFSITLSYTRDVVLLA